MLGVSHRSLCSLRVHPGPEAPRAGPPTSDLSAAGRVSRPLSTSGADRGLQDPPTPTPAGTSRPRPPGVAGGGRRPGPRERRHGFFLAPDAPSAWHCCRHVAFYFRTEGFLPRIVSELRLQSRVPWSKPLTRRSLEPRAPAPCPAFLPSPFAEGARTPAAGSSRPVRPGVPGSPRTGSRSPRHTHLNNDLALRLTEGTKSAKSYQQGGADVTGSHRSRIREARDAASRPDRAWRLTAGRAL